MIVPAVPLLDVGMIVIVVGLVGSGDAGREYHGRCCRDRGTEAHGSPS